MVQTIEEALKDIQYRPLEFGAWVADGWFIEDPIPEQVERILCHSGLNFSRNQQTENIEQKVGYRLWDRMLEYKLESGSIIRFCINCKSYMDHKSLCVEVVYDPNSSREAEMAIENMAESGNFNRTTVKFENVGNKTLFHIYANDLIFGPAPADSWKFKSSFTRSMEFVKVAEDYLKEYLFTSFTKHR